MHQRSYGIHIEEVSLFPINEAILELAKVLITPGVIPVKAGPDAVHIAAAALEECEFLLTWNFPPHRERSHSSASGNDFEESWLYENDNLHSGRTLLSESRGKMKSWGQSMRCATPMRRSTITI
jgi:hypothetical protein